jgi:hypothetical protein
MLLMLGMRHLVDTAELWGCFITVSAAKRKTLGMCHRVDAANRGDASADVCPTKP